MAEPFPQLAFFGHHKCMTWTTERILRRACMMAGLSSLRLSHGSRFNYDLGRYLSAHPVDFVFYTNADARCLGDLGILRGFHIVRDPRDIVASAYFSHLHSHPTHEWTQLTQHRQRLQQVSKNEGLLLELQFRRSQFEAMEQWNDERADILELRMEDMIANFENGYVRVFEFLGLRAKSRNLFRRLALGTAALNNQLHCYSRGLWPVGLKTRAVPPGALARAIRGCRFEKMSGGRQPGQEDSTSHFRKGTAGDWRNHFTAEHIAFFKRHYNALLLKLGYESDADW